LGAFTRTIVLQPVESDGVLTPKRVDPERANAHLRAGGTVTPGDRRILLRVVGAYAALSVLWILLSDHAIAVVVRDADLLTSIQSIKGVAFVVLSAGVLFGLLARELRSRRAAEADLDAARGRFRAAFDSSSVYMALLRRRDRMIVDVNAAWAEALGHRRSELVGRTLAEAGLEVDEEQKARLREQLSRNRSVQGFEHGLTGRNGRRIELLSCVDSVSVAGEQGWLFVASDITHLRRSEAELRALERQFQQAQKMEALGTLAGGVAHDFNNLLGVIMSYADFARESLPPGHVARDDLAEVISAGKRATALTQQLLAFCRQQATEPAVIHLDEAVTELRKMLGRLIGEDIELNVDIPSDLPPIFMDPQLFDQVIINLAVNARDAMPRGGTVRLAADVVEVESGEARATRWVRLQVRDTGHGMDAETQQRAFEPFFSTKGAEGTGLGLSLVYGAIKQAGGEIVIDSEVGKGTRFDLAFPTADVERLDAASARDVRTRDLQGTESILVVEDEGPVRELVRRILSRHGYEVTTAADAAEALRLLEEKGRPVHLVVSDVVLPRMSGVELGRELSRVAPQTPILFMTGYVDDTAQRHGLPADTGDLNLIRKPFNATDFVERVRALLDAPRG
jgi:PAS domain S-box-containing protein